MNNLQLDFSHIVGPTHHLPTPNVKKFTLHPIQEKEVLKVKKLVNYIVSAKKFKK